jgi:hypothetical protein
VAHSTCGYPLEHACLGPGELPHPGARPVGRQGIDDPLQVLQSLRVPEVDEVVALARPLGGVQLPLAQQAQVFLVGRDPAGEARPGIEQALVGHGHLGRGALGLRRQQPGLHQALDCWP